MRVLPPAEPEEPRPEIETTALAAAREAVHLASLAALAAPPESRARQEALKASIDAGDAVFRMRDGLREASPDPAARLSALLRLLVEVEGAVAAARTALGNGQADARTGARRGDVREPLFRRLPLTGDPCSTIPPPRRASKSR